MVWLISSSHLRASVSRDVGVAVCLVVQRVYRVNLVGAELLLLGLIAAGLHIGALSELAATVCDVI